jgi:hypothetical protein
MMKWHSCYFSKSKGCGEESLKQLGWELGSVLPTEHPYLKAYLMNTGYSDSLSLYVANILSKINKVSLTLQGK